MLPPVPMETEGNQLRVAVRLTTDGALSSDLVVTLSATPGTATGKCDTYITRVFMLHACMVLN